jgi:lactoylglutathione lyase
MIKIIKDIGGITMKLRFELFVNDIQTSLQFYKKVLGFQSGVPSNEYVDVFLDSVEIGLCKMDMLPDTHPLKTKSQEERKGLGVEIVLVVDNLEAYYNQVLDSQYPIAAPLQMQHWNLKDFRLLDPDGYYIRVTGR